MAKHFEVDTDGTLTTSLVSYWKMDGDSTDFWGSNDGTDTGTSYGTSYGKINKGVDFTGSSTEKIAIAAASSLDIAGAAFSISFWAYFPSLPSSGHQYWLFWKGTLSGASPGYCVNLNNSGGTYYIDVPKFGITDQNIAWTPSTNTWYSIVVIQNYSGGTPTTVSLYVNGSHIGDSSSNSSPYGNTSGYDAYIGGVSSSSSYLTTAYLDEIGVWSKALSAQEITDLYNGGAGQTMVSSTAYTRTMNDSIMLGASPARESTIAFILGKARTLSDSIMNAASRSTTIAEIRSFGRAFSDSIMNAASRLATLASVRSLLRDISVNIMNAANRLATFSIIVPLWTFAKRNAASWATHVKNAATWAFDSKHGASWTERSKSNPNQTKDIPSA